MVTKPEQKDELSFTEQQLEAKSWEFLDRIAAQVAKFPKSLQKDILNVGKELNDAKVLYVHVVNKKAIMAEIRAFAKNKEIDHSRQQ